MSDIQISLDFNDVESYRIFLRIKTLPRYRFIGRVAQVPEEYASMLGIKIKKERTLVYKPISQLFDYQRDISKLAIKKKKFGVFMQPGLGKTLIDFSVGRYAIEATGKPGLLIAPPGLVIRQMIQEYNRFFDDSFPLEKIAAADLPAWLSDSRPRFGITNWQALREGLPSGNLGFLGLSEASYLKSHYGAWGSVAIELGRGVEYKLTETGTPAPNDRIEYANQAVFLDQVPTVNSFLARYFVNRGETSERWEMKAHAVKDFWRSLSHWCIFVENPVTYGWKDNTDNIPPIHVHIHDVPLTPEQQELVIGAGGDMYGTPGGITSRSKLSQLAKGHHKGKKVPSNKPGFIRDLVAEWRNKESTIIWCRFNAEQEEMETMFPGAASIEGSTKEHIREQLLDDFLSGRRKECISKSECLGWGLNIQIATRHVFNSCEDSYERFVQCLKRSNRIGSKFPLNAHLPVTEIERPQMENVLRKAKMVKEDMDEQERLFRSNHYEFT